jgi:hypothetical protein
LIEEDSHRDLRRGLNLGLMLIRVVRAVNDFILSGSFSEKTLRGGMRRGLPRRFFVERGDSGEGRAPSVVFATSRPGFGPALKEALAFALAFSPFFL